MLGVYFGGKIRRTLNWREASRVNTFRITYRGEKRPDIDDLDRNLKALGIGELIRENGEILFDHEGNYHVRAYDSYEEAVQKICMGQGYMVVMTVAQLEVDEEELRRRQDGGHE